MAWAILSGVKRLVRPQTARQRFGAAVRAQRRELGWSQEDLAEQCGLNQSYIGGVERGERNLTIDNMERIALALDVTLAELLQ